MQCLKLYFLFALAVFRCLLNDIALKGFLLQHCVDFFLLFYVAIGILNFFFLGGFFQPDFAAIGRKKFGARSFWFKAKVKQKKFIFK